MSLPIEAIYGLGVSHNKFALPLPDGTWYPEWMSANDNRALQFLTHFDRVRDKDWTACTFLDLGCSEGSTTFGLSQTGATAYGVEGRADGIERANALRGIIGFDKTHFSVGNVDHETSFRQVDGIFNSGILYHLSDPILCLERCARSARLFIYLDSGHAPRSDEERVKSKFTANFGKTYQIDYHGLQIDAVDFAEPKTAEKPDGGVRRGPRSSIGNSTSVWLAHHSVVPLMAKLGFTHHETIYDNPIIPRLRTCFFRQPPGPVKELGILTKPLPPVDALDKAIIKVRQRDIAYLKRQARQVLVIGRDPVLSRVMNDLHANGIKVSSSVSIPGAEGDRYALPTIKNLVADQSGLVVAAESDVPRIMHYLMRLDQFDYAFASFALAHARNLNLA